MRRAALTFGLCGLSAGCFGAATAEETPAPERVVHRFLEAVPSPDGKLVASVEGDSTPSGGSPVVRDLVVRQVDTGVATTIAVPCGRVPQCWPGSPSWAPDGKELSFALRAPGGHSRSVYSVAPDGSGLTKLLEFSGTLDGLKRGPGGKLAMLATENATKELGAYEAGAPIAGDLDEAPEEQRIAILEAGALHFASPPDLFVYEFDWQPDGSGFVGTAAPGDGDNNYWTAKLYAFPAGGPPRLLYTPTSIHQQLASPKVSRDGKTVAFIGGIMSDFGSTGGDVYTAPLAGGTATNVTPGLRASASALGWSCAGKLRAELLTGDKDEIAELGDGSGAAQPAVLWSGSEGIDAVELTPVCPGEASALIHETFTAPPEIEVGTIGHWKDVTQVNAGLTMPLQAQSLSWKSDGFDVQGWLLTPQPPVAPAPSGLPMVTIVHGGPAAAITPHFFGPGRWRSMLQRGYVLFLPNPRGSYGQGEKFTLANVRDFGRGDLRDILRGIDAAKRVAPIDESRLGITGHSYGGFMTMWAVTQTHRFKAAVAGAGIANWLSYYGENGIDAWMLPYFGKSVYEDPAAYARLSPINFIKKVRTPTLEFVGEHDLECPAPQTQEFWHALKTLGVPTSSVIYPGEGHALRDPLNIADIERRTLAWFDKYLR
jgi:dipeptidyl aminopeptidase/acylaminoacyl peptidase